MSWNTAAIFVRGRGIDEVAGALPGLASYERMNETVDWSFATSGSYGDRVSLAESHGWCQVWDPYMSVVPDLDSAAPALKDTTALSVTFSGVSDSYEFSVYVDGARVRSVCFSEGEPVVESGDELPVEAGLPLPDEGPDEDYLWELITEFTGLELVSDLQYTVYTKA
ncbi:MAG: hypothetical protein ACRD0P_05180 [Stackebrandtia sp.]